MKDDDLQRAKMMAARWLKTDMTKDDLLSLVAVRTSLTLLQNFSADATALRATIDKIQPVDDDKGAPGASQALEDRSFFNNDLRYRGLRQLCTDLRSITQKKAILFFTVTREQPGGDNQIEVRAAVDACRQANASINPVDVALPH